MLAFQSQTKSEATPSVPLTETPTEATTTAPTMQYWSLIKHFAVRLCVSITLVVLLLVGVEFYSYLRFHPNVNALELAAKLEIAQNESPAEREYWSEFKKANKVTYHPWVLWRRQPFNGELITIDQDGIRRTPHNHCEDKNAVTIDTTNATSPKTDALATSTPGRRGVAESVARIVPVPYSALITMTPRTPMISWATKTPVKPVLRTCLNT